MHKIARITFLSMALFLAFAVPACSSNSASPPPSEQSVPAPDFQLSTIDGQSVSLSAMHGHPVLLNFWATWCGPCRFEMPSLQEIYNDQEYSDKGLVILAVDIGEDAVTVQKFLLENKLSFTVLLDTDQSVAAKYNIRAIPTTFFIDKDGIIKGVKIGAFASTAEIRQGLDSLMQD